MSFPWLTVFLDFPPDRFGAGVAFWQQVTGYGLSPSRGADSEFATLLPLSGDAYLRVQRIRLGAGGCHLDLHVNTGAESLDAAAGRARASGALMRHFKDGLVVAESPGGFPFCLVAWESERAVPPPLAGNDGGASRVAYYAGWAWLKMPVPDTLRLGNLLLGTGFHDRVTRRWQRGSWRMHIPVIFDEDHGIGPDDTAQIHLPKDQVPDLSRALERMTGAFG